MKHEWRKKEKELYLPKTTPVQIHIPEFSFFTISGEGNPNSDLFAAHIQVLYALSYAVKMSPRKNRAPAGYFDYAVYPMEGVWDVSEQAKKNPSAKLNKDELVYTIMIRQPDFVDSDYAQFILETVKKEKPLELLSKAKFEKIHEGDVVQMLHLGSYDDEPASFAIMEDYAREQGRERPCKTHREIYLTDARKTAPEKQKTVLRFGVK